MERPLRAAQSHFHRLAQQGLGRDAAERERRQQQADLWLQRSRELGYERLRLLAPGGNLLAQAARVGSGMVLLEAEPIPQP